jgi:hypothetical protein
MTHATLIRDGNPRGVGSRRARGGWPSGATKASGEGRSRRAIVSVDTSQDLEGSTMRRARVYGLALAGIGIGAVATSRRRATARIEEEFRRPRPAAGGPGERPQGADGLPMTYDRVEEMIGYFAADLEPVRALLPTDSLHPIRLPRERTIVAIAAGRYLEGTAPRTDPRLLPYGEVLIAAVVTPRPAPPILPLAAPSLPAWGAGGAFCLHNPISHRAARDAARDFGLPAFVADLEFEDGLTWDRVSVSDEAGLILRLTVNATGPARPRAERMVMYAAHDGVLLRSTSTTFGLARQRFGKRGGSLELGGHPLAGRLRALGISTEPIVTRSYPTMRIIVPAPVEVGTADRYPGYAGTERERGRYTIRRPGSEPVEVRLDG